VTGDVPVAARYRKRLYSSTTAAACRRDQPFSRASLLVKVSEAPAGSMRIASSARQIESSMVPITALPLSWRKQAIPEAGDRQSRM